MKNINASEEISPKRNTGLWVPDSILILDDLSIIEKLVFSKIHHLDNDEMGCYANNRFFANYFKLSKTRISQIISALVQKGYILNSIDSTNGNKRYLKTLFEKVVNTNKGYFNTYRKNIEDPISINFKHNKEHNKKLNKEGDKRKLSNFDFLNINDYDSVHNVKSKYNLQKNEWEFCVNKFNKKKGVLTIIDFENYVSNWKSNLKSNEKIKELKPAYLSNAF